MKLTAYLLALVLAACSTSSLHPARCASEGARAVALGALPEPRFDESADIAPDLIRADLQTWLANIDAMHPEPERRIDRDAIARVRSDIEAALDRPIDQREAWLLLARLNPHFRDGHTGILFPDRVQRAQAHLDAGGRLLPIDVAVEGERIFVLPSNGERAELLSINGRSAAAISREMLAVTEGDTLAFRQELASRRFAILYWLLYGDTGAYVLEISAQSGCSRVETVAGANAIPARALREPPASAQFSYDILESDIGYLRAASFDGAYADAFDTLAAEAFAAFKAQGIRALIIDVRDNGGGDDDLWMRNLMERITDAPYRHVSSYAVRITERNVQPGEAIGAVRRDVYRNQRTPAPENAMRFRGPTYVLVGPFTYSSAIVFSATVQDNGVARIAGHETGGMACQTGRITSIAMPNTGLAAFAPQLWLARPSGESGCTRGIIPDLPLDRVHGDAAVQELAARIRADLH